MLHLLSRILLLLCWASVLPPTRSAIVGRCPKNKQGSCTAPNAHWQKDGICIQEKFKSPACHVPDTRNFSFMLVAGIATLGERQIPSELWIKGSGPGLSWEKTAKMRAFKKGYWDINIQYKYDSNAILCYNQHWCSFNQRAIEFRVYSDAAGTRDMIGPNFFIRLPVSNSIVNHPDDFKPPPVFFFPSFHGERVVYKHFSFMNPLHFKTENQQINVTLFYPPSYLYNLHKRYPTVVVFGNDLHNQLVPLLESMHVHEANMKEAFIIAVHHSGTPPYCAYNTFIVIDDKSYPGNYVWNCSNSSSTPEVCETCMTCYNKQRSTLCSATEFVTRVDNCNNRPVQCEGHGGAILDSIENVVLPELAFRTMSRMLANYPRERISIIGIDGGGLLACFAALSRPLVYKDAACLSAPFHWPLRYLNKKESRKRQGIGFLLNQVLERMEVRKELQVLYSTQKYYIDVDADDNKFLPIIETYNYSDWVVKQIKKKLHLNPANMLYFKYVEGTGNSYMHLYKTGDFRMMNRIKSPLLFFLKPDGGFSEEYPRTPKISGSDLIDRRTSVDAKFPKNVQDLNITCDKYHWIKVPTVSISTFHISIGKYKV